MEEEDETTSLVGGAKVADEENPDQEDMVKIINFQLSLPKTIALF